MSDPEPATGRPSPPATCSALSEDDVAREGLEYSIGQVVIGIELAISEISRGNGDQAEQTLEAARVIADCCHKQAECVFTIEQIKAWRRLSNGSVSLDDPDHGIVAWSRSQAQNIGICLKRHSSGEKK